MVDPLDRFLDRLDLETDLEDVQLDSEQLRQLASIRRLIRRETEKLMATLDDINTLVAQTGADAQAAADRVLAAIAAAVADASTQIAALQAQVQALIDGNAADITPEQLQAVADGLTAADTTINTIAPSAAPAP
jgi:hypothetical protein